MASDPLSYWRDRFYWSESQVASVDLLGTHKALAKLSRNHNVDGYQSIGLCPLKTLTN
jgi:hypothetical protein